MKKLLTYIKDFIHQEYTSATYTAVLFFLCVGISLNYGFHLEPKIHEHPNLLIQFFLYLLVYSVAYYGTLVVYFFTRQKNYFTDREVMFKSFLALSMVSFDRAFALSSDILQPLLNVPMEEAKYLSKLINLTAPFILYFFAIYFLHKKYNRGNNHLYGLSFRRFDLSPYIYMLFCMIPLLALASFRSDFTEQYPFFKYWNFSPVFGWSLKQMFAFYEFFYLANFINIELLFRGLLVIGMVRMMGQEAVLPMIVTYAFLHFGKPLPETISSIFGGYLLGIFALKTENIVGGIFIHMAIAFLMDLFAILQLSEL